MPFKEIVKSQTLSARFLRSSAWSIIGYGGGQVIRFASNLVLTRILFPEDFGLMALVTVFLVGLMMISDVGLSPSIQQSSRGDDPVFLDTAWTIQILRGLLLWGACFVIAPLGARFYDSEHLSLMLPVAGISLLVAGFTPTRVETANRHLKIGVVTSLDITAQFLAFVANVALALILQSVWALVIGTVIGAGVRLFFMVAFLPGHKNRIRWESSTATEIVTFGRWIFLSTVCGFLLVQSDKAILGKYIDLSQLGIYNIGFFLASVPQAMAASLMSRILIPIHREWNPLFSHENYTRLRKTRFVLTFVTLSLQCVLAWSGIWVVDILYSDQYSAAGGVLVAIACMNTPYLTGMTYDYAALAAGDSKGMFFLQLMKTILQLTLFSIGFFSFGLVGALAGVWLSQLLSHIFVVRLARKHGVWDWGHDLVFGLVATCVCAMAIYVQRDELLLLLDFK
jgi:O-antigen/teichoic acid export membrane protein